MLEFVSHAKYNLSELYFPNTDYGNKILPVRETKNLRKSGPTAKLRLVG